MGTLKVDGYLQAGSNLRLWSDTEGANIRFITATNNSNVYELDTWNDSLRLYYSTDNGVGKEGFQSWNFSTDGVFTTKKLIVNSDSYFKGNTWINNSSIGGSVLFLPSRSTDGKAMGLIQYYACGSTLATSYNLSSFYFSQYSYKSSTYTRTEYYDRFYLPSTAADKTANNSYQILTSKNLVTIAQGGTGASTKADAANNILRYGTKNGNFNDRLDTGYYWTQLPSCTNTPYGDNPAGKYGFLEIVNAINQNTVLQRYTSYHDGDTWVRSNVNGWQKWINYLTSDNYSKYALPLTGGTLSGVLTVNQEVRATLQGLAQFRAIGGAAGSEIGAFIRNDGNDTYILLTDSGNAYGTWNNLRPFRINNSTGNVYIATELHLSSHLFLTGNLITNGSIQYENSTYTNKNMITFLTGDANGAGMVIGGGGCVIIGAGESAANFQSAASIAATTETTYITSDTTIQFYTNCQTIANRKNVEIDASAKINAGGKAELWTDSEGGNLRLTSPGGNKWSIDALNNSSLRFIWEEKSVPITFNSNGTIVANYLQGTAQYANSATASNSLTSTGFGNGNFTYVQTSGDFYGASNWAHYLIANHGDGASYYNYVIRLPFWKSPQYKYQTGNTSATNGWYDFHTTENVIVQSAYPGDSGFHGQIWLKI